MFSQRVLQVTPFSSEMALKSLLLAACILLTCIISKTALHGKVLLLMLDGLRWDLFGLDLPELQKVEEAGVKAEWMDGVFVSKTIPSAFSIVTGKGVENMSLYLSLYQTVIQS